MRELQHEHVIKMFEVYESDGFVHMVLEVLTGGELFDKIRQKFQYSETDAKEVMKRFL